MAANSTWVMIIPRWPWAPPPVMDGTDMAFAIRQTSCYLDALELRFVVYIGEDRVGKAVDDLLNCKRIAWRHDFFVVCL
jgi:hypothetical protein